MMAAGATATGQGTPIGWDAPAGAAAALTRPARCPLQMRSPLPRQMPTCSGPRARTRYLPRATGALRTAAGASAADVSFAVVTRRRQRRGCKPFRARPRAAQGRGESGRPSGMSPTEPSTAVAPAATDTAALLFRGERGSCALRRPAPWRGCSCWVCAAPLTAAAAAGRGGVGQSIAVLRRTRHCSPLWFTWRVARHMLSPSRLTQYDRATSSQSFSPTPTQTYAARCCRSHRCRLSTRRRRGASSSGSTLAALARKGPSPKLAPCAPRRSSLGERRGEAVRGQREVGSAAECAREMSGPLLLGEKCLSLVAEVRLAARGGPGRGG
mmetsp:Transcript_17177/g.50414  ORF Transcript_17177/g.50414 Transcript_17177/m.50414 type:complete len:326 (-) Transcript_17177:184-1161(-)